VLVDPTVPSIRQIPCSEPALPRLMRVSPLATRLLA
jgi:hypothetical protein